MGRVFRIFVSSTFTDLIAERNALQLHVFPRLRDLCIAHDCQFQAIDLRWGVSDEAALDQQTMPICLDEIVRCQETTPRPNFIVLLGDRYGWRPLPAAVPADEFAAIRARLPSPGSRELLDRWYRRDDNALHRRGEHLVQGTYLLQPRSGRFVGYDFWEREVERPLGDGMREAIRGLGLSPSDRLKYEASATHQEIEHGVMRVAGDAQHVFGLFRRIANRGDLESALPGRPACDFVDTAPSGQIDVVAQQALADLRSSLRARIGAGAHACDVRWTGAGVTAEYLGALPGELGECMTLLDPSYTPGNLCEAAWCTLGRTIEAECKALRDRDPLALEKEAHAAFGRERTRFFTGRADGLQRIAAYLDSGDREPLVIYGASGSGKSALLAKACERARGAYPGAAVVCRFIGATPGSANGRALLEGLCGEISRACGAQVQPVSGDYRELVHQLRRRLALATARRPVIVFLDGLDQLSDADNACDLAWLPASLPAHARLVVSVSPGDGLRSLQERLSGKAMAPLDPMKPDEVDRLLTLWLADAGRSLQPEQRADILAKGAASGLPLYLRLAFDEARRWRSYDGLPERPGEEAGLSPDTAGVVRNLLKRLSHPSNHGPLLVSRALGYLVAARNGLAEHELLDVLAADEEVLRDFAIRARHTPPERRLPVVVWSRLRFDLEPYLAERSADGVTVLAFFHRQVADIARQDFLAGHAAEERHSALALYFAAQPHWLQTEGGRVANGRKVAELPYQETGGRMWAELQGTLTDLEFVEAKCSAGMTYGLLRDYDAALAALPSDEDSALGSGLGEFSLFLHGQAHILREAPHLAFQQAANEPDLTAPAEAARLAWEQGREVRRWLRWLNKPRARVEHNTITLSRHDGAVTSCAFCPDGSVIASASSDHKIMLWDAASGQLLRTLGAVDAPVRVVRFTPDGKRLISGGGEEGWWGEAHVWDVASGARLIELARQRDPVAMLWPVAKGERVLTVSSGGNPRICLFETGSGKLLAECRHTARRVLEVSSPLPDQALLLHERGQYAEVVDPATLGVVARLEPGPLAAGLECLAAIGGEAPRYALVTRTQVAIWDPHCSTGPAWLDLPMAGQHTCVPSRDRRRLFITTAHPQGFCGALTVVDERGSILANHSYHGCSASTCACAPESGHLLVGLGDGRLQLWPTPPDVGSSGGAPFDRLPAQHSLRSVSPDDRYCLAVGHDPELEQARRPGSRHLARTVSLLEGASGGELRRAGRAALDPSLAHPWGVKDARFSPGGQEVAVVVTSQRSAEGIGRNDRLCLLGGQEMNRRWCWVRARSGAGKQVMWRVIYLPVFAGTVVATLVPALLLVVLGQAIRIVGRHVAPKWLHRGGEALGDTLVRAGEWVLVRPAWKRVQRRVFASPEVRPSFAAGPAGQQIVWGDGHSLVVIDGETGILKTRVPVPGLGISAIDVAPDGRTVACCGLHNREAIRLVDLLCQRVVRRRCVPVRAVGGQGGLVVWEIPWCGFSPDGRYVAAAVDYEEHSIVHFWTADLGQEVCQIPYRRSLGRARHAWGPDSRSFALWTTVDQRLAIWAIPAAAVVSEFSIEGWPDALEWTGRAGTLWAATEEGRVYRLALEGR